MSAELCHCGAPVAYGFDGDPTHHRGMCADCDAVRCDAFPLACQRGDQPCERCVFIPTPDGKCICREVAHVDGD